MIKLWLPYSFQISKVEVINTYLAKFQVNIPMMRPFILNVKFRFTFPPLLDSRSGREPHKDLELVGARVDGSQAEYTDKHFRSDSGSKQLKLI